MINCITIDDEPLALLQIVDYITKTPYLNLVGKFESAIQALEFLQKNQVDLMFVDINMPDLNGMTFVKSLKEPPKAIFTTAYSEYALDGFSVDAVDFLVKPIAYESFLKASEKAKERFQWNDQEESIHKTEEFLFIKSEYKIIRINFANIKYIEGMREYVRIHLENQKPVMALLSMKKISEQLPNQNFMRIHRSYIVNLNKITTIERNRIIFEPDIYLPVSEQYKEDFQKYLDNYFFK